MESFKSWLGVSEQKAYEPHKGGELAALYNILNQKVQTAASVPMTPSGGTATTGQFDAAKVGAEFKLDKTVQELAKRTGITLTPSMITKKALEMKRKWDREQQTKIPGKEQ